MNHTVINKHFSGLVTGQQGVNSQFVYQPRPSTGKRTDRLYGTFQKDPVMGPGQLYSFSSSKEEGGFYLSLGKNLVFTVPKNRSIFPLAGAS